MFSKMCICINLCFILFVSTEAGRILAMFPTPAVSHNAVFHTLTRDLVKRGHELVVITAGSAFPKGQTPENCTEIDVHDLSYSFWKDHINTKEIGKKKYSFDIATNKFGLYWVIFEKILKLEGVRKLLDDKSREFDLLLIEAYIRPLLIMSHFYKVPAIQLSSLGPSITDLECIGAPSHPIFYPVLPRQDIYNLTWWEKIITVRDYLYLIYKVFNYKAKQRFFAELPTTNELNGNIHLLALNIHPIWEGNHPVPPSVVYMRGLHLKPARELPQDLKYYLDSSKNGVIYMSFGTSARISLLPPEKVQLFVRVLSQLPYDVLLKWEKDDLPGRPDNIRIGKWFPQADLLRHPNIKLFITQGGMQSKDEALAAGVPLVGIPMISDQWYNTDKYPHHKIGVKLDFETIDEQKFRDAIITVIEDDSYRRNVIALNALMSDCRQSSKERVVHWTEHLLRHEGAGHMRAPAADLPWHEYFLLDILLLLLFTLRAIMFLIYLLCSHILRLFLNTNNGKIKFKVN